jgi:acetyltransferase-like isoleucine patch superfamily enzyme
MKFLKKMRKAVTLLTEMPYFATKDVTIGRHVRFGRNVVFNCRKVRIGDGVIFHDNITVNSEVFLIGDYATIYPYCFFPGPGELKIGHNFWLGIGSIVDSRGDTRIGNNVGIGPHSQLWTHMIYGDVMAGGRFHSVKPLIIEDDAWLVGHCLVSPVKIGARSLAFLGSVVTKDLEADRVYAGVPAVDITEKVGPQFEVTSIQERTAYLQKRLEKFSDRFGHRSTDDFAAIVTTKGQMPDAHPEVTLFNVADRTYRKLGTDSEYTLIRFLLPEVKFLPFDSKPN